MANNLMYAMTLFRQSDTELYHWYQSFDARVSRSQIGREAFECFRLFNGSLAQAQDAARALAEMRRMFGPDWENEVKRFEKAVREV